MSAAKYTIIKLVYFTILQHNLVYTLSAFNNENL